MFGKILVANRGEIACRVMRTAKQMGIQTVAVYSDADANALHVQMADEAVHIGGSAPAESYLLMDKVIAAAEQTGAEAIHPGYGFLSENAAFCKRCADAGVVFIGPPVGAIESMGSKSAAKSIMEAAGVPLLPGYHGSNQDLQTLQQSAGEIGYPVLLKAVSGGGGKGMRQVHSDAEFSEALAAAKREAQSSFGDDAMLVEKYLLQPRHVEVQVFCDAHGGGVYLFERDCSVQRRHQKIIEEAPAPGLPEGLREQMGEAALRAAAAVSYVGAGTVEFLLDAGGAFYFMEMNTRLQVEHPVTEMITGQDLVEWQLLVANGGALPCTQEELSISGHAFEARVYAEDPNNDFLPAAGSLSWLQQPVENAHIRVDTGVVLGDAVGVFYDPMIAKLVVWGEDRARALQRLVQALGDYQIVGVTTNIDFLRRLASHDAFAQAQLATDFIEQHRSKLFAPATTNHDEMLRLAALYLTLHRRTQRKQDQALQQDSTSPWNALDGWRMNAPSRWVEWFKVDAVEYRMPLQANGTNSFAIGDDGDVQTASGRLVDGWMEANIDGHQQKVRVVDQGDLVTLFVGADRFAFHRQRPDLGEEVAHDDGSGFKAPMNGTLVDVLVSAGDEVDAGDTLVIMEAMKMEQAIKAPAAGIVREVFYSKGDLVDGGAELLAFEPT